MDKKIKNNLYVTLALKFVIIIGCIIGVCDTAGMGSGDDFMSAAAFLFFTVQSNLWIAAISIPFIVYDIKRLKGEKVVVPQWVYKIKFIFTVAITLTFLVFSLMLSPQMIATGYVSYLYSMSNIFLHNLVPICAIIDWSLNDYECKTGPKYLLYGAIMPLLYYIFAMIASVSGVDFGNGARVPYFFMEYYTYGWFRIGNGGIGTAYWFILLVGVVLGEGLLFVKLKDLRASKMIKVDEATAQQDAFLEEQVK